MWLSHEDSMSHVTCMAFTDQFRTLSGIHQAPASEKHGDCLLCEIQRISWLTDLVERTDERMNERTNEQTNERTNE